MATIKLDLDIKNIDWDDFASDTVKVLGMAQLTCESVSVCETTKGYHVVLETYETIMEQKDILILQLFLGSDKQRELFGYRRIINSIENWNVLFSKKTDSDGNVLSEEIYNEELSDYLRGLICANIDRRY